MKTLSEIEKILERPNDAEDLHIVYFLGSIPIIVDIWRAKMGRLFYLIRIKDEKTYRQARNWQLHNQLFATGQAFYDLESVERNIESLREFLKNRVKHNRLKNNETLYFTDYNEFLLNIN
jgi:hypothetical protein